MKVLVVGGGAREHALCVALSRDPQVEHLVCAPGNAGIAGVARVAPVKATDPASVVKLAASMDADLVVIGPEAPLVAGVADAVRSIGIPCFGPSAAAARLEGSKAFAKEIMAAAGVATARALVCTTVAQVKAALTELGAPHVVKDDGLAAGKGVVVTDSAAEALAHAKACLAKDGGQVLVEEFLDGPEVSLFCVTDGTTVVPLEPAADFKRLGDGDAGPNTGGMGAYSPLPWAPRKLGARIARDVAQPVVDEMRRRGTPFAGLLYCGMAMTSRGPRVVEFNARFGDPETQVVLARLATPLAGVLLAAAEGRLSDVGPLAWVPGAAVTVVVAAEGYPVEPVTGDPIHGLAEAGAVAGVDVLHAGTRRDDDGLVRSAGGRVLSVTASGADLGVARQRAYEAVDAIGLRGSQHRRDIAAEAAEIELAATSRSRVSSGTWTRPAAPVTAPVPTSSAASVAKTKADPAPVAAKGKAVDASPAPVAAKGKASEAAQAAPKPKAVADPTPAPAAGKGKAADAASAAPARAARSGKGSRPGSPNARS